MEAGFAAGAFLADHGWVVRGAAGPTAGGEVASYPGDGFKIAICARVHKRLFCYLLR